MCSNPRVESKGNPEPQEPKTPLAARSKELGEFGTVGIHFVLCIGICFYAGSKVDDWWFRGHDYGKFVGFLVGVATGFKALFDTARKAQRRLEAAEQREREERERVRQERARRKKAER